MKNMDLLEVLKIQVSLKLYTIRLWGLKVALALRPSGESLEKLKEVNVQ